MTVFWRREGGQVAGVVDRLEEKRREAYRWEPTPADITRMVNAIWKT